MKLMISNQVVLRKIFWKGCVALALYIILIDHGSFSLPGGCCTSFLESVQEAALLTDAVLAPLATPVSLITSLNTEKQASGAKKSTLHTHTKTPGLSTM